MIRIPILKNIQNNQREGGRINENNINEQVNNINEQEENNINEEPQEKQKTEDLVNEWIKESIPVEHMEMKVTIDKVKVVATERMNPTTGEHYNTYALAIPQKDKTGCFKNHFATCKFKSGEVVGNNAKIKVNNAFLTFNPNMPNGYKYPYFMITDYEVLEFGQVGEEFAEDAKISDKIHSVKDDMYY